MMYVHYYSMKYSSLINPMELLKIGDIGILDGA